jgi:DNA-binding XRE family transcriptional regulator
MERKSHRVVFNLSAREHASLYAKARKKRKGLGAYIANDIAEKFGVSKPVPAIYPVPIGKVWAGKNKTRDMLGREIRARRADAGLTMVDMATKCGLSQAQISRIETGHQGFRLETLQQIARVLGVKVSDLLRGAGL